MLPAHLPRSWRCLSALLLEWHCSCPRSGCFSMFSGASILHTSFRRKRQSQRNEANEMLTTLLNGVDHFYRLCGLWHCPPLAPVLGGATGGWSRRCRPGSHHVFAGAVSLYPVPGPPSCSLPP